MNGPAAPEALARGLTLAKNALDALRMWARAAEPRADLVATVDAVALCPTSALRRQGDGWLPVALPPVHVSSIPPEPVVVSLHEGRHEAFDDLLFSLGLAEVLMVPLAPPAAGALLIARSQGTFTQDEIGEQAFRAAPLGVALAQLGRRRRPEVASNASAREVASLFQLARDLAYASGELTAARACASCLVELLDPAAGAVLLRAAADAPPVAVAWPEGAGAQQAVARAAEAVALPLPDEIDAGHGGGYAGRDSELVWLVPAGPSSSVSMALAWVGEIPEAAVRITTSVQASLALAADRLAAQHQREEQRLRAVVDGLPIGVALIGLDGRIRLINPSGRAILEAFGAWPGDGPVQRIASADVRPLLAEARRGGPAKAEIYSTAGARTLEVEAVPAGPAEPGRDVLLLLEDVSEARRQKAQLTRSEKLSALGVLISGIVHEINNPLATILGYAQMLSSAPDSAQRERWLRTLEGEAKRCQRIVGNLLTFARPQEPGRRTVSLGAIAEKALSLVSYSFRSTGIDAVLHANPDAPAVDADPDGILQALINLLTNALHAMEGHTGTRQVAVEIQPSGSDRVLVSVRDSGPGIAPEHLDRVFDPFFTTKPEGKGTGLGLSLVAATIRDHGGVVEVESAPGQGACFRILLPASTRHAGAPLGETEAPPTEHQNLRGVRVLVVDDEPAVASLLAEILEGVGAAPRVEKDPRRALESMIADPPDALIWDLSMAGLPGRELVEELHRRAPALVARLIFASGDLLAQQQSSATSSRPLLGKPFDLAAVLRIVGTIVTHGDWTGDTPAGSSIDA